LGAPNEVRMWNELKQFISGVPVALAFTAIAAVSAAVSAFLALQAIRIAARSAQTQLYMKFREKYEADRMRDDLRNLRAWREKYEANFAEEWGRRFYAREDEAMIVDSARRRVKFFFVAVSDLYAYGLLSRRFALNLLDFQGIDLLYEIVEPLEKVLNPDYNRAKFDTLRKLKGSSGRGSPLGQVTLITNSDPKHPSIGSGL
jgi:hypothetical protein